MSWAAPLASISASRRSASMPATFHGTDSSAGSGARRRGSVARRRNRYVVPVRQPPDDHDRRDERPAGDVGVGAEVGVHGDPGAQLGDGGVLHHAGAEGVEPAVLARRAEVAPRGPAASRRVTELGRAPTARRPLDDVVGDLDAEAVPLRPGRPVGLGGGVPLAGPRRCAGRVARRSSAAPRGRRATRRGSSGSAGARSGWRKRTTTIPNGRPSVSSQSPCPGPGPPPPGRGGSGRRPRSPSPRCATPDASDGRGS